MVVLGIANSRMKDFYDLWIMSKQFDFDGSLLTEAITATFERRKTLLHDLPLALTEDFSSDATTSLRWKAFANKLKHSADTPPLNQITGDLKDFLVMPLKYAKTVEPLNKNWKSGRWG